MRNPSALRVGAGVATVVWGRASDVPAVAAEHLTGNTVDPRVAGDCSVDGNVQGWAVDSCAKIFGMIQYESVDVLALTRAEGLLAEISIIPKPKRRFVCSAIAPRHVTSVERVTLVTPEAAFGSEQQLAAAAVDAQSRDEGKGRASRFWRTIN